MERLIMEFSVGDGYTYSADVTYPIVYSSKNDALNDFELMLIEKIDALSALYQTRNSYYETSDKLRNELQKIASDKRISEKDKENKQKPLYESFHDLRIQKISPLEEKIKETELIHFGGQSFELHNFVYRRESDQQFDYTLPNILTLNEYFSTIEKNLSLLKKNKP